MSTESSDAEAQSTRMIHPSLGRTTPFWRGMTLSELALFLVPPLLGFIVISMPFTTSAHAMPIAGLIVALEVVLLLFSRVKPEYYRLTEWLLVRLKWGIQEDHYGRGDEDTDTATAVRLKQLHPDAVERLGGHYVGAVEVEPANMALEDEETWRDAVTSLTDFVASTLDFRAKIHITTREANNTEYVEAHRDRLDDDDVTRNPALRKMLDEFVDDRTDEDGHVDEEVAPERRYYVVTWVTDDDVLDGTSEQDGLLDGLRLVPLFGTFVSRFQSNRLDEEELERHKHRKLEDQLEAVRRGVANLHRCRPRQLDPEELAHLVREYWTCGTEDAAMDETMHAPLVTGQSETEGVDVEDEDENESEDRTTSETGDDGGLLSGVRGVLPGGGDTERAGEAEGSVDPESEDDGEESDDGTASGRIERRMRQHRRSVAPSDIEWESDHAVVNGEKYARTFWIEAFPEEPSDGFLREVLLDTELAADMSIHLDPYDSQSAVDIVSDWIATLETTKHDASELKQEDIEEDIAEAKRIRQLVRRNETSLVQVGVFLRLVADSEEQLRRRSNKLKSMMQDSPANCIIKKVIRRPEEGIATVSPIGRNELGTDRLSTMTAEAVGAMFPFSSNYMRMDGGIEYGTHVDNGSEVRINPWELDTGHSELVTGMPGAGKSHASQARGLRTLKRHDDALQVIIDPVGGMRGTAEALNAKYITVSGKTPLNPCEMQPTPEHLLEQSRDMQPVAAKKDEVFSVVENFLSSRDINLEMHSGVITHVIDTIFERSAIDPEDPTTHTPANSPTMQDFIDVLEEITERPEKFDFTSEAVQQQVIQYASELSVAMQPFREGSTYANLSKRSDMDIVTDDNKVVYLDLQQVEGSGDGMGKQSFIMQLLLSTIYQQAKRTEQNVEVIIDEAHYLFNDTENLEFLNQIARHQRHAGIRLVMLTQTLQEFHDGGAAEEIASMCPIKVHHREPGLDDETAKRGDLTDAQQWFIQSAEAGKQETGFSEALVRVDEHGDYPVRITTSPAEKTVIEYDDDARGELETILEESEPEHVQELRDLLESEAVEQVLAERYDVPEPVARKLVEKGLTESELVAGVAAAVEGKLRNDEQARRALQAAKATIQRSDEDGDGADAGTVATDGAGVSDRSTGETARTGIGDTGGGGGDRERSAADSEGDDADDDVREQIRDRLQDKMEE